MAIDPILRILQDAEATLTKAWREGQCLTCPIGELAAQMAAARTLYEEKTRGATPSANAPDATHAGHWSDEWRRNR